jgi:hypothetical protein
MSVSWCSVHGTRTSFAARLFFVRFRNVEFSFSVSLTAQRDVFTDH